MELVDHASKELELAGLFDKDSDYGGMLGDSVLELVQLFAAQRHSGFSAMSTLQLFEKLTKFENLSPITSNPKEWMKVGPDIWQSNRNPAIFSVDGGETWYKC